MPSPGCCNNLCGKPSRFNSMHCLWWQVQALQIQKWAKHRQQEACEGNSPVQGSSIDPVIHRGSLASTLANIRLNSPEILKAFPTSFDSKPPEWHWWAGLVIIRHALCTCRTEREMPLLFFHFFGVFTALAGHSHENTRFIWVLKVKYPKVSVSRPLAGPLVHWCSGLYFGRAERSKGEWKIETLSCPTAASHGVARKRKEQRFKGERASASCEAHCEGRPFRWHQTIQYILQICRPCNIPHSGFQRLISSANESYQNYVKQIQRTLCFQATKLVDLFLPVMVACIVTSTKEAFEWRLLVEHGTSWNTKAMP